jgi:hypothetical protein
MVMSKAAVAPSFAFERDCPGTGFAAADHLKCAGRDAFEDGIGNRTCGSRKNPSSGPARFDLVGARRSIFGCRQAWPALPTEVCLDREGQLQ